MLVDVAGCVHPSWLPVFEGLSAEIATVSNFLEGETAAEREWLPNFPLILRAFTHPLDQVKVVILGQDPYPTPGHSVGLAFVLRQKSRSPAV